MGTTNIYETDKDHPDSEQQFMVYTKCFSKRGLNPQQSA